MKTIVTITGIRPDFIRMSEVFKKLDKEFNHILIHTGQHYNTMLSDVFFKDLDIRKPDYNLNVGGPGREHYHQNADVSIKTIELFKKENISPDMILFLGDSNSVACAMSLKKEGYRIGHIEAGMRSGDKRMLEEINRTVCDHCSDYHFVYHDDYKENLVRENLPKDNIFVVGNTIVEPCINILNKVKLPQQRLGTILLDIHRPENFKYRERLYNILLFAQICSSRTGFEVELLSFPRTMKYIEEYKLTLGNIRNIDLLSYTDFIQKQASCAFIISDSGTAQEEPALMGTPVIVPRDYTERPQSVASGCSKMLNVNDFGDNWFDYIDWAMQYNPMDISWLGDGNTSNNIIEIIKRVT